MRPFITILFFVFITKSSVGQSFTSILNGMETCWKYMNLPDSFEGTVINFYPNTVLCGKIPTASIAIVKLNNGDTLRVLQLCGYDKSIKPKDLVTIFSGKIMNMGHVLVPGDEEALTCRIKYTLHGGVRKKI